MVSSKIDRSAGVQRDTTRIPQYLHQDKGGLWFAEYERFRLRSSFQPVYRRADDDNLGIDGFEGLVKVIASGLDYRADDLFSAIPPDEVFKVDRICRAIHFRNFALSGGGARRIYVNMAPMTYRDFVESAYDFQATTERLARFGLSTSQAVIEIVENKTMDFEVLKDLVTICRDAGAKIALDDFGSKFSNVDRMVALEPDIVKLDCVLLKEATNRSDVATLVRSLVQMAVEFGADVVMEGVETRAEMQFALSTGASMFQGNWLAPPNQHLELAPAKIALSEFI